MGVFRRTGNPTLIDRLDDAYYLSYWWPEEAMKELEAVIEAVERREARIQELRETYGETTHKQEDPWDIVSQHITDYRSEDEQGNGEEEHVSPSERVS